LTWNTQTFAAAYFDGAPTKGRTILSSPTATDPRISLAKSHPISSTIIPSKLDIHQRNQYNRVNHISNNNNNNNNNRIASNSYHSSLPSSHIDQSILNVDDLAYHHHHHHSTTTSSTSLSPTKSYNYFNRTSAILQQSAPPTTATQSTTTTNSSSAYNYYPNNRYLNDTIDPYVDEQTASDNRRFTERRKKTVRFDGQDSDELSRWENERQGSQDSTTKDSGIDTSSTFTSSEDSNRGDGPKVYYSLLLLLLHTSDNQPPPPPLPTTTFF